jgi:hypothetical protein
METERLDKLFQQWNRFMYLMLGASITILLIGLGTVLYGREWPGFDNYVGGIWSGIQLMVTPPGFYLLWGRRWKPIPLSSRINTIMGYFAASWINLLAFGVITKAYLSVECILGLLGAAILVVSGYVWFLKRTSSPRDEMFP